MGIQINGNTNNINAGIGSLSIEDINELDIVGVATAANFKTGVSNLHSVGLTLSGGQIDVGSNIKLGNAGVITATSFVGDGSGLTGAGPSLTGSTNNTVCTVTGANAIQGEANLTYDGNTLQVATDTNMEGIKIISSGDTYNDLILSANRSGANNHIGRILGQWGSGKVASIIFNTGGDASGKDDGEILFATSNGGSSPTTRMNIKQDGQITIGNDHAGAGTLSGDLVVAKDSGGVIIAGDTGSGEYLHLEGGSGLGRIGTISNHDLVFVTNGTSNERIRIKTDGRVIIGGGSAGLATGDEFTIHTSAHTGMTIRSGTSHEGNIFFGDSDYGAAGIVRYDHSQNAMIFKTNSQGTDKLRINSNGDLTTTGAASFTRSNAGFTARAGDSVQITRASGTPLEISRTGNNGQMINIFRDTTGVAQIGWDGSYLTLGTWSNANVLKVGSTIHATAKFNVDYTVSGSSYIAYFRNSNANSYGVSIQEPSSVNTGYPLLSISNSSGGSHFRVDTAGQVYANSGAGTDKKAYFVRAWVNFDGQGGSAGQNRSIQDSQNVSSVYDNDAGDFTINFTTNMPTSAYAICGMASNWEGTNSDSYMITSAYKNVTYQGSCRIRTIRARFDQHPPQFRDSNETMIAIIC